jgi:Flp pilus assembly protein TadD
LATALASLNNLEEAEQQLKFVISENSKHVSALNNLGYLKLKQGLHTEAFKLYKTALQFEPDNEPLLLNLAGYYALMKNKNEAKKYLEIILKNNPKSQKAKMAMQQINRLL